MTNKLICLITIVLFFSCTHKTNFGVYSSKRDSLIVDSIYGKGIWKKYFKEKSTPNGNSIKLCLISDSTYLVEWGKSTEFQSLLDTFKLDGRETWLPIFKTENKDYIILFQHCGNPCWTGYFLPLSKLLKYKVFNEYVALELDDFLVAFVLDGKTIRINSLKTDNFEDHIIEGSFGSFPNFDTISIRNRTFKYKNEFTKNSYKIEPINIR